MSVTIFKEDQLSFLGKVFFRVLEMLRLVQVKRGVGEDGTMTQCNNLTLINFFLVLRGPMHEERLTMELLAFQVWRWMRM